MADSAELPLLFSVINDLLQEEPTKGRVLEQHPHERTFGLKSVIEFLSEAVVVSDSDKNIVHFNHATLKTLGLAEDQLLKKSPVYERWNLIRPDGTELLAEENPAAVAIATGQPVLGVIAGFKIISGDFRWVRINAMSFQSPGEILFNEAAGRYVVSSFLDVTEIVNTKIQLRKALDESSRVKAKFANLFKNIPVGLVQIDSKRHFVSANTSACRFFGYSEDELRGRSVFDITHPDDVALSMTLDDGFNDDGFNSDAIAFKTVQKRYIHKSGKTIWAKTSVHAIESLGEEARTRFTVIEDITEQVISEKKLTASIRDKFNLQKALDMHSIVVTTDLEGTITSVNDKFCEISKYSRDELIGQDHRILNSGHHTSEFMRDLWMTISAGKVWQGKIKNKSKDGEFYWVATTIMPVLDERHEPSSYVAIRTDITEQMDRETDYGFILNSLKVGVWELNLTTNTLKWDEKMYQLYDTDPTTFNDANEAWQNSLSAETRAKTIEAIDAAKRGEQDLNFTFQISKKNGEVQELRSRAFVAKDHKGLPLKIHGITIDRNQEAKLEKEMDQQRAKAQHSAKLASLGELSAGIAHEINNPLTIISGSLSLLRIARLNEENFNIRCNKIERASERIVKIVNGLKKFSRNSDEDEHKVCRLSEIIKEALVLTETRAKQGQTVVTVDVTTDNQISCDEVAIEQVLINLINNAIDAIETLAEKWVKIELTEKEGTAIVRITDSGPGIPEEIRSKLFNPFFTTKPVGVGTGLGLSVTIGILASHGATIRVDTESPNTCFEITFKKASDSKSIRVLFLDDEPDLCDLFAICFASKNISVSTFSDPKAALASVEANPPDLIFLDYNMPYTTGDELAFKFASSIPKYLITGTHIKNTKYPFLKVLEKPFNEALIRNIISSAAKGR